MCAMMDGTTERGGILHVLSWAISRALSWALSWALSSRSCEAELFRM